MIWGIEDFLYPLSGFITMHSLCSVCAAWHISLRYTLQQNVLIECHCSTTEQNFPDYHGDHV